MPITVEVPGVGLIDFEDDFSEDQISEALAAEPWKQIGGRQAEAAAVPSAPAPRTLAVPPINPVNPVGEMSIRGYTPRESERTANIAQAGMEAVGDTLNTPLYKPFGVDSLPTVTGQDIEQTLGAPGMAAVAPGLAGMAFRAPRTTAQIIAGLQQAVVGATEFFTTPAGALTLGAGSLPQLAQKGIAAYFVYEMAKHSPEMVKELAEAWYSDDTERLTRAAGSLGLNTAFIAGGAKAVLERAPVAKPPVLPRSIEAAKEAGVEYETPKTSTDEARAKRIRELAEQGYEVYTGKAPSKGAQLDTPESLRSQLVAEQGEAFTDAAIEAKRPPEESTLSVAPPGGAAEVKTERAVSAGAETRPAAESVSQPSQPKPPPVEEAKPAGAQAGVKLSLLDEASLVSAREVFGKPADLENAKAMLEMGERDLAGYENEIDTTRGKQWRKGKVPGVMVEGTLVVDKGFEQLFKKVQENRAFVAEFKTLVDKLTPPKPQPPAKPAAKEGIEWNGRPLQYWKSIAVPQKMGKGQFRTQLAKTLGVADTPKTVADALQKKISELESVPAPAAKEAVAPVAEAKMQAEVSKVAASEGKRSAKEIKADLIDEIQQRLQAAPAEAKPGDKVTIEIPDDGTFTIPNTVEAISEILKRAKRIKTDPGTTGIPKKAIAASSKAIAQSSKERLAREASETAERSKSEARERALSAMEPLPDPRIETHFKAWLDSIVYAEDRVEVERKMRAFIKAEPEVLEHNGWTEIRNMAERWEPPARTTAGEGQVAETKLAQIVNDTIEQSTSPNKLGITPAGSARPTDVVLGATDLKSVSPKAEARWQESVREKPSLLTRLQDTAVNAWHSITREYADLPPREFPEQIDILRRLRASRNASARRTVDVLRGITHNLGPKQYGVFNRVVVLEDLLKDVESGKYADGRELPSGHADAAELTADLNKFKSIAESTPEIKAALERRGEFMNSLRETLVERGFLPETVLQDPRYFHHQVLMYLAAAKSGGAPKSFRDWFSGWQKARVGSSKAYNRQYVEAEAEVIADAFNKMTMQDLQGQMEAVSDLTPALRRLHGEELASHVPANYARWQPKRGNVFYPVKTVAERVMEEYLDGLRDILPEEFKDAVAIGPKRAEWIIPKELAKVLDNLAPRKDTWIERLAGAGIGAWKRYILLNPLRAMKYQVNNASGDVDFVFAANPRIFNEFKQAAIDSYAFHKKGKAATGDVKEAIDLGVVQSGWRASEIPDIGGAEYFNWLTGSKPGIVDRYWKWIGKWNDAREDTARLATYRFALKEWDANKPFYGASVPADVQALPTNKLKAAKVARELLIDYGRETEFGEFMRRKAVPFYRWMHGNFARYVQLVRNIPVQEGSGAGRLAAVGAKRGAVKAGALAARGAFAYMAINLWNNLMFPDEEEELGDTRNQLHLILGRDEQGNIQTIRFQGALSDLLGWVGLENLPQDIEDLLKGKASLGDKMQEGFEAGVSRAVNATSPFYKTAAEAMTGRSLYPNALEPRPIRDKAEHVAGLFSLKNVYQWLAGKPHKPLRQELSGLLTYTVDPGEAAYNATRHMAAEWLEDHGEERSQIIPGKRANALYYYKQALRYKDPELAAKFKAEYEALGGKQEGLAASVQRSAPLASLGKKQAEFLKSLSTAEKAVVDRAQKWYQQVYR